MLKLDASDFISAFSVLQRVQVMVEHGKDLALTDLIDSETKRRAREHFKQLLGHVNQLDLQLTAMSLERLQSLSTGKTFTAGNLAHGYKDIEGRMLDELRLISVFCVDRTRAAFYEPSEPLFGVEVFDAFPSANDDISEAGACLALGRATACVMHLMRVAEVGLKALGTALGIGPQNDWGSYLREIEAVLDKTAKASGSRTAQDQFFSEAAASFDYLKRAWRNPTMHVERTYTPERAEAIFNAVRSFMQHLATQLSEPSQNALVL